TGTESETALPEDVVPEAASDGSERLPVEPVQPVQPLNMGRNLLEILRSGQPKPKV
ncbi:unnamed protein product, partial [Effrenium voratum]